MSEVRCATTGRPCAGAGTVEFLADDGGKFFFLEMNTRLQVEHPVTECTTGLDLVALQISVANGGRLDPEPPPINGHAIEVRLYAEDPAADWQPQSGTVHKFSVPGVTTTFDLLDAGIRLDSGVEDGSVVGIHYDPMLAKVISFAPTRTHAASRLATALARTAVHGLVTNRDLLVRVLRHPAFLAGETDTAFFDRHGLALLAEPLADKDARSLSALAAALADAADAAGNRARAASGLPSGWRTVVSQPIRKSFTLGEEQFDVGYRITRDGLETESHDGLTLISSSPDQVVLAIGGVRRTFDVATYPGLVAVDSPLGPVALTPVDRFPDPSASAAPGSLLAPMPGAVVRIDAEAGDNVEKGQPLLWLEAMKMQHAITAPISGTVAEIPVRQGQQVEVGAVLAVVKDTEEN
jgi:propionyl-CoA carboxylase alpha chain